MSTWKPPTLTTSRLTLRAVELSDAEALFEYTKNPEVSRYTLFEPPNTVEETRNFIINYALDYYTKETPEPFAVTLKESPETIIGTVGCFWTSKPAKAMELAYALSADHWGKGIMAEAALAVTDHCFKEYGLKRIQARCKVENHPSIRVMEKIGMTFEGTLRSLIFHKDRYWDMHYYSKIAE